MRAVLGCAAGLALAGGVALAGQAKKDDGKKPDAGANRLVGKWEPAPEEKKDKKDKAPPPAGPAVVVEFAADGGLTLTVTEGGKDPARFGGTYKLEGDKLSVALRIKDQEVKDTLTVKKLTDDELVTEDSKSKTETLRRKK